MRTRDLGVQTTGPRSPTTWAQAGDVAAYCTEVVGDCIVRIKQNDLTIITLYINSSGEYTMLAPPTVLPTVSTAPLPVSANTAVGTSYTMGTSGTVSVPVLSVDDITTYTGVTLGADTSQSGATSQ